MTEPRGRALIVSNDFNQTRAGSEHDYQNMKRMLDKLGFVTVGSHENYTAAVSIIRYYNSLVFLCESFLGLGLINSLSEDLTSIFCHSNIYLSCTDWFFPPAND